MRHWRWYSKVLFALVLAAFAYWVWPTPWERFQWGDRAPGRVNRFTGAVEFNVGHGWHRWNP